MPEQLVSPKVEELAQGLDRALETGRHLLVIAEGDCESISMCTCGTLLGADRPDVSADLIVERWQRHAMARRSRKSGAHLEAHVVNKILAAFAPEETLW